MAVEGCEELVLHQWDIMFVQNGKMNYFFCRLSGKSENKYKVT